jgi:hypothetical protein
MPTFNFCLIQNPDIIWVFEIGCQGLGKIIDSNAFQRSKTRIVLKMATGNSAWLFSLMMASRV